MNQIIDFGIVEETKNQIKFTDVNIKPNLEGLNSTSFDEKNKILKSGYDEAMKYLEILDKLPKKNFDNLRMPVNPIFSNIYKIDDIEVENNKIYDKDYIIGKMTLKLPSSQTYGSINKMIDKLYATNNYKIINYEIIQKDNKNVLKLFVTEDNNRLFLKFGLHYDDIFKSGLLANITVKRLLFKNSSISIDGVFGDKSRYYVNYFIDNGYIPGIGLNASGMSFDLKSQDKLAYETWNWYRTELFIQSTWRNKFAIGGGISYDVFNGKNLFTGDRRKTDYLNPYVFLKGDTQDSKTFPKRGYYTNIEAKSYDFIESGTKEKSFQIKADIRGNFPITKFLTYRLRTFYGVSFNTVDDFYQYHLGGIFEQNLVNFVKFNGYEFGEASNNNVFTVGNDFQFNFMKNYYVTASLSVGNLFDNFNDANFIKINYSSFGITAGYDSPFGQIKINYSNAFKDKPGIIAVVLGHWF